MRVKIGERRGLLLLAALAAACASTSGPPAQPTARAPADIPPVAANAGVTFAFHHVDNLEADVLPPELERLHIELRQRFGVDVSDRHDLAGMGADPGRPVVVSWAIVDPARLRALLASRRAPARSAAFSVRTRIIIPIVDAARAAVAIAGLPLGDGCARATWTPDRWAAAIARLPDAEDRRAAGAGDLAHFCRGEFTASVARIDAARREVTWVAATGSGALLAETAAPLANDAPFAARLVRDGFFRARTAVYTTPDDEARGYAATDVVKILEALAGVGIDDSLRDQLWRQGAWEVGSSWRLLDGAPRLFAELRVLDGVSVWTLTDGGKTAFASMGLGRTSDAQHLKQAIVAGMKPSGPFADPKALVQTVREGGNAAFVLVHHFLWPQALAFAAANPEGMPAQAAGWSDAGSVEIDTQAGMLRVGARGAR